MSGKATGWALEQVLPQPTTKLVLVALADECRRTGSTCFPSRKSLADCVGVLPRSLSKHLVILEDMGLVRREDRFRSNGSRTSTLYHLAIDGPFRAVVPQDKGGVEPQDKAPLSQPGQGPPGPTGQGHVVEPGTKEPGSEPKPLSPQGELALADDNVTELFDYWRETMGYNGSHKLTPGRRRAIAARLKEGYGAERIRKAIKGCRASDFHMGDNPKGIVYNDLTLICRNGEKVEQFERLADGNAPHGRGPNGRPLDNWGREQEDYDAKLTWAT